MHPIKRGCCLLAALTLLLGASCNGVGGETDSSHEDTPAAPTAQDTPTAPSTQYTEQPEYVNAQGERLYTIPLGANRMSGESWVIDGDGNEATAPEEAVPEYVETYLTDLATGEIRYRSRSRDELAYDAQGYPRTRRLNALFDPDGNQLTDWEEKTYREAFGEYIIRQDLPTGMAPANDRDTDYRSSLYHVPTGEDSYEGAQRVVKLKSGDFLLIGDKGTAICVLNSACERVSAFPLSMPYYSLNDWNGYVVANSADPYMQTKENRGVQYLLEFRDGDFHELLSAEWMSGVYGSLSDGYLAYRDGGGWGIYRPGEGTVFETDGASVEYYDGELAIVQTGAYRGGDPIDAALVTAENAELAGGFSWLKPVRAYEDASPAEKFVGISGGKAVLVERGGNILASSPELPGLASAGVKSVGMLCDGLYTFYMETDNSYGVGLLGPELELLVPTGRYVSIDLAPGFYSGSGEWDGTAETAVLRAGKEIGDSKEPGRSIYRFDILDHTGRIIVDNVADIYDVGSGRIALRRGFDVGLMDLDGNWIAKRRVFTGFGDD